MADQPKGPALYDPVEGPDDRHWMPANTATEQLLACVQACKDISRYAALFAGTQGEDRRALGRLAVPVIGLADALVKLRTELGREDRSTWPTNDQANLVAWGKEVARYAQGPLRRLRDQREAHYIADSIRDRSIPLPSYDLILPPLAVSLALLVLYLNHEGVFAWSRRPDAGDDKAIQLSQGGAIAPRFEVDGGRITALLGVGITPDPRHRAREHVVAALSAYNELATRSGKHPPVALNVL